MDYGRSRGRSRSSDSPPEGTAEAAGGEGGGEPAMRGRGGLRSSEVFVTIPSGVTNTVGDGTGTMKVLTNYVRLKVPDDQVVYNYRVDFDPQVESTKVRRGLVYALNDVFSGAYVFDGGSEIKALTKLDEDPMVCERTRRSDGASIKMRLRLTTTVGWGHPEMLRLYNTQMRRNLQHLGFSQIGRDYYDKGARIPMPEYSLEVWPGILTAINEHNGGILMCVEAIHKIIRGETALGALRNFFESEKDRWREVARRRLPGSIVMTQYNNKTYRIDDVVFDKTPNHSFERRGQNITLAAYYAEQYQLRVTDDQQPLLLVQPTERMQRGGDNKEILLIPEFCIMTGITDEMNSDFRFKQALAVHTRLDPQKKVNQINGFMHKMATNETVRNELAAWGLAFDSGLTTVNCKTLPPEKIQVFGDTGEQAGSQYSQHTGNFERDIRSKKMLKPVRLENWALIAVRRDKQLIDEFFGALRRVCTPLGIEIGPPKMFPIDNDSPAAYLEACKSIPEGAKMVIAVLPNAKGERYPTIKRYFCCEVPVCTQVITTKVLSNKKNLMSVSTKVLIQMATKLGAEPWGIHIPPRSTMVVGYDTYHDSERRGYSVGGFVSSTNYGATRWFSRTSYHQNREELCANFAYNLRAGLRNWQQKNNEWPARIIIYRDGVSEGQIYHVFHTEMRQLSEVLKEKEGLSKTQFTFIIVTKRVNARFFLTGKELSNPPPATIIDSVVTRKERYDFYLISQSVRQGTVNPTMYNIIADNTGWSLKHQQQLAYKLCHLYYNWAGTITVPAPCQYAHKLAYLTGTALHKEHHMNLQNQLFFL